MSAVLQYAGVAASALGVTGDRPLTGPLYAQISISDPCDHRCVMCPYHPPSEARPLLEQFGGAAPGVMSLARFTEVADDLHRLGTRRLDLVGRGEPLLNPHVVEMITHAKRRGLTVTMISNGSRLTRDRAQALSASGLDAYRLSLDAGSGETYAQVHVSESPASFGRIRDNLRGLAEARVRAGTKTPHLTVSFTINSINWRELPAMIEVTREAGADAAHFQHVLPLSAEGSAVQLDDDAHRDLVESIIPEATVRAQRLSLETNLRAFAATPRALDPDEQAVVPCYVGSFFTVVLGNGNVMPCCQTEIPVASLGDERFSDIWRGERYRAFRRAARRLPEPSPELATCACDRCYFRPHNVSVHNAIHPLSRIPVKKTQGLLSVDHLLRMSRLDRKP